MKLKNTDVGPRGFYADGVPIVLDPGATSEDVKLSGDEMAAAQRSQWFSFDGDAEPVSLSGKNKAELLAIAKAEGVDVEDGATNDDIKSAIELHREG